MKKNYVFIKRSFSKLRKVLFNASLSLVGALCLTNSADAQTAGYVKGDFHQHTTFTDGSYSFGYMMNKNTLFGLDWWANSEHGGGFAKNGLRSGTDLGNTVYWDSYSPNPIIGTSVTSGGHQVMWRWQSLKDSSFAEILHTRSLYPTKLVLQSYEMNVPGHEHGSLGLIANQFLTSPNANPLAQFEFMFDNSDADLTGGVSQGWVKSTLTGHAKTIAAITWLQNNYPTQSYLVLAHPERKPVATGYSISAFRDMNNAGPGVCFGFESMPGHQKDPGRGGYTSASQGGGTYGGTGIFAARIGGLWDALLSEGRNWWLFANSDCHDAAGDFFPGEYQKNYTYSTNKSDPQALIDALRSGNNWVVTGDLIDSLIFEVYQTNNISNIAKMGQHLTLANKNITIHIRVRDPQTSNYNTFGGTTNPVLDHIDIIAGKVTGLISSTDPRYNIDSVTTTQIIARFDATGNVTAASGLVSTQWTSITGGWKEMTFSLTNVQDSMYFRLRGSNFGLNVTNETDGNGNPKHDTLMGSNTATKTFADLWFYSNPIFVNKYLATGIPETILNANIIIFPNPANERLNILIDKNAKIQLLDMCGKLVYEDNKEKTSFEINTCNLNNGVFMLRIYNENFVEIRKVVISK